MTAARPLPTAERWRRFLRDQQEHRRRSAWRRSQGPRFLRYIRVIPRVFLAPGAVEAAPLVAPAAVVRDALRGRATWTLDTAARLRFGVGLFRTGDLTGYADGPRGVLAELSLRGLVGPRLDRTPSVDPVVARGPLAVLSSQGPAEPRPLETGDLVVGDARLIEDMFGTVGFRPDLLARLEARGLAPPSGGSPG